MLMTIADVLDEGERDEIVSTLSRMRFEDGRATAGRSARLVKDNEQARAGPTLELLRGRARRPPCSSP